MLIPKGTQDNLLELNRVIKEFQIRQSIIIDTLIQVAGIKGKYQISEDFTEIIEIEEN
jgi:hypothetical protein